MPTAVASPQSTPTRQHRRARGPATVLGGVCCPRCKSDLTPGALVDGHQQCLVCAQVYEAVFLTPVAEPGPVIIPVPADGSGTPCAKHARNVAESSCQRCGSFMCALCRIDSDGQSFCPGCFDRLSDEGALASSRNVYRDYGRLAVHILLVGLLMAPIMCVSGPAASSCGIIGLRKRGDSGNRISSVRCWVAIIVGMLEMLLGIGYFMLLSRSFK